MRQKRFILAEKGRIELENVEVPKPKDNEVLIKVETCGLCAYDLGLFQGHVEKYPITIGHEPVGKVVEVGKDVKNVKVGDRVTGCGDADFAEYGLLQFDRVAKIPDWVEDPILWISEPPTCVVMGLRLSGIEVGDTVVVIGTGYMGLLWIQALAGKQLSRLIAVDVREERLKLAKEFGADIVIDASKTDAVAEVKKIYPRGVNVVIEVSGTKGILGPATQMLATQGILGLFGWHFGDHVVPLGMWLDKGIEVRPLSPVTSKNQTKDFYATIPLMEKGTFNQKPLITHRFKMEEIQKAFEIARDKTQGYLKGVLQW